MAHSLHTTHGQSHPASASFPMLCRVFPCTILVPLSRPCTASSAGFARLPCRAVRCAVLPTQPCAQGSPLFRSQVLGVWVAPEVEVEVTQQQAPPRVVLEARSCHLPGSPFFKSLEGKFALHFRTELAWCGAGAGTAGKAVVAPSGRSAPAGASGAAAGLHMQPPRQPPQQQRQWQQQQQHRGPAVSTSVSPPGFFPGYTGTGLGGGLATGPGMSGATAGLATLARLGEQEAGQQGAVAGRGEITGQLSVEVWAETLPPFHLVPRPVLESSCNTVLGALIGALLPLFMRR
jgi:hypothetical protein